MGYDQMNELPTESAPDQPQTMALDRSSSLGLESSMRLRAVEAALGLPKTPEFSIPDSFIQAVAAMTIHLDLSDGLPILRGISICPPMVACILLGQIAICPVYIDLGSETNIRMSRNWWECLAYIAAHISNHFYSL